MQVQNLNPEWIPNLNASNNCGIMAGQISGLHGGAMVSTAAWTTSNAALYTTTGGLGFPCYLVTNSAGGEHFLQPSAQGQLGGPYNITTPQQCILLPCGALAPPHHPTCHACKPRISDHHALPAAVARLHFTAR